MYSNQPCLFSFIKFCAEFRRIHGTNDMKELLEAGLQKYASNILDIFTTSKSNQMVDKDLKLDCTQMNNVQRDSKFFQNM